LPVTGIIKKEPLEGGRPILKHANQLSRAQERVGHGFGRVGDAQPVDSRTNRQIGVIDDDPATDRDLA